MCSLDTDSCKDDGTCPSWCLRDIVFSGEPIILSWIARTWLNLLPVKLNLFGCRLTRLSTRSTRTGAAMLFSLCAMHVTCLHVVRPQHFSVLQVSVTEAGSRKLGFSFCLLQCLQCTLNAPISRSSVSLSTFFQLDVQRCRNVASLEIALLLLAMLTLVRPWCVHAVNVSSDRRLAIERVWQPLLSLIIVFYQCHWKNVYSVNTVE